MLFIAIFAIGISSSVLAQDASTTANVSADAEVTAQDLEVSDPGILPDSPFYFMKEWSRRIRVMFSFNSVAKAELENKFANEKVLELKEMAGKNSNSENMQKASENYEKAMERVKNAADKVKTNASTDENVNKFLEKFANQQMLHERILQNLEDKVSDEVLEKIQQAREQHLQRFQEVMQKLEQNQEKITERIQNALQNGKIDEDIEIDDDNSAMMERMREYMSDDFKEHLNQARGRIQAKTQLRACTMDAKLCPDGSYVGRTGPNCEFAPCLGSETEDDAVCKKLWWFDDKSTSCQQKQFCGAYMYQTLRTFENESDCKEGLNSKTTSNSGANTGSGSTGSSNGNSR